jgi:hypothetical protein
MWDAVELWWLAISPPTKAALVGALATVLAASIAAYVVFKQIGRQALNAINQNRINEATKLKLEQYRAFVDLTRAAGDEAMDLMSRIARFTGALNARLALPAAAQRGSPPPDRFDALAQRFEAINNRCIAIISWVERWNIIDPRLDLFQRATNVALHDIMEAQIPYSMTALRVMARNMPDGALIWDEPTEQDAAAIQALGQTLSDRLMTLSNYLHDFDREMQNLLLGELFQHQLSPRRPMDPRMTVVALSRYDQLMRHFNEETPWARARLEANARVREQLAAEAVEPQAGVPQG